MSWEKTLTLTNEAGESVNVGIFSCFYRRSGKQSELVGFEIQRPEIQKLIRERNPIILEALYYMLGNIDRISGEMWEAERTSYAEREQAPAEISLPRGYVYLIKAQGNLYKIGQSKNPEKRFRTFQGASPHPLKLICTIPCIMPGQSEAYLHNYFKAKQRHNEWFELSDKDVALIKAWRGDGDIV